MRRLLLVLALAGSTLPAVACRKKPVETEVATFVPPPPAPPKAAPAPPPAPPAREELVTIYFDFDRSELRSDQLPRLRQDLAFMQADSAVRVRIEGHCDERGTTDYNLALGERRAKAARDWLVSQGIAPSRIRTISYGEERPVDPGHDEAAWARNRRDEFHPEGGAAPLARQ